MWLAVNATQHWQRFSDSEYEAAQGATPVAVAAMIMRRYMYEYGVQLADFANFSVNAHANGAKNANAMYRISFGQIGLPVRLWWPNRSTCLMLRQKPTARRLLS